jgi:hypothetical protein
MVGTSVLSHDIPRLKPSVTKQNRSNKKKSHTKPRGGKLRSALERTGIAALTYLRVLHTLVPLYTNENEPGIGATPPSHTVVDVSRTDQSEKIYYEHLDVCGMLIFDLVCVTSLLRFSIMHSCRIYFFSWQYLCHVWSSNM